MATVLNRVAQVVQDLITLNVIKKFDDVRFSFVEEKKSYFVWIILGEKDPDQDRDTDLETIKTCFEKEFQDKIIEAKCRSKQNGFLGNQFTCFVSAD